MIWYKLSFIFGFFITTGIGIAVFIHHPRRRMNQYWALLCLSVALWNFGRFMRLLAAAQQDHDSGMFWCRVMYIGAIMIPLFFYFFIINLLDKKPFAGNFAYLPALFFLIMDFTPLMIKNIVLRFSLLYYPVPGVLYPWFLLYFLVYVVVAHYHLYKSYKISSGYQKTQIRYVGLASIIGFFSGLTTFPLVFNIPIPPIGAPLVSFYTLIIAYAIVKYRLMDIHIIISKTLTYTLLVVIIVIPCFLLIHYAARHFINNELPGFWFSLLVISILLFLSFLAPKVKIKTERTIEQALFPSRYDYLQTLKESSQDMVSILNLQELLDRLVTVLHMNFGINSSSVFLFDARKRCFTNMLAKGTGKETLEKVELPENNSLFLFLKQENKIVILEELEQSPKQNLLREIIDTLHMLKSEICVPLFFQKRLIGIINLGKKQTGEMYTNEDLKILSTLANQAAISIENAQLYQKMLRTDRLAAVGTLAARLAHEIRNPLVSIKTVTELLPERIDDPEFRNHFLGIAINEINRIKHLVDDLLNFAKPSIPKFRYENINRLVTDMVHLVEGETKSKGVQIIHDLQENLSQIMVDKDQIKQVFLNLLLNAIQACNSNGIITVNTRMVELSETKHYVQISVHDNGIGIPEKDLENLFNPFFTTKHEGIGLGLSTAHQIVQEHQGYMEVESMENEGTTFYINLPANQSDEKVTAL